jgi:fucose permease
MAGRQVGFWLAVAGVGGVLAPVVLNLVADSKAGDAVPGLRTLNAYATRRNG